MAIHRVFVTRHYIAVEWYDVEAPNERKAKSLARKVAYKITPDARATAVDNGWIAEDSVVIERPGQFGEKGEHTHEMQEIVNGVYTRRC